ncbi:MAG TPA: hypothetical protein VGB67_08765, partial [Fibrella sp.]
MNKFLPLSALVLCSGVASAQTAIGTNNRDQSAIFELASTTKGFLTPRMTAQQRRDIVNPATGLVVYQTNSDPGAGSDPASTPGLYTYNGTAWTKTGSGVQNITGGSIDGTPIGATTPATGSFTDLTVTESTTLNGDNTVPGAGGVTITGLQTGGTSDDLLAITTGVAGNVVTRRSLNTVV